MPPPVPVTIPEAFTVAIVTSLLLHVPPAERSLSVVADPSQVTVVPEIAAGCALTVTTAVVVQPLVEV